MFKRLIIFLITIAVCTHTTMIYSQESAAEVTMKENEILTMRQCINIALLNNPEIKAAISDTDINKTRIGQAKAAYVPEINFSGGYNFNNTSSYVTFIDNTVNTFDIATFDLTQLIYDFGKTSANIKIQKTNLESSREDLQSTINNTVYDVKKGYYDLLLALENLRVYEESVKMYSEQLKQAEAFYKVGEKPKVDVLTAKVNLSNANLEVIKAKNDVILAYAALNNAMGIPEKADYEISDELKCLDNDYGFNELIDIAIENRPDYKSALLKSKSAKLEIKLAKTEFAPRIEAFGGYNVAGYNVNHETNTDTGWRAGARLNLISLNIYRNKKKIDEAKASYDKEIHNAEILKNRIYLEIQQAFASFQESKKSVPVAKVAMEEAKENYDMTNGRYKVGFGNHIELKDADIFYVNAKLAYYKTLYDLNLSLAMLEKYLGQELIEPAQKEAK